MSHEPIARTIQSAPRPNSPSDAEDIAEITRQIDQAREPYRTMIQAQMDAMPATEREQFLLALAQAVRAYKANDLDGFTAVLKSQGYGEYAAILWESLGTWLQ